MLRVGWASDVFFVWRVCCVYTQDSSGVERSAFGAAEFEVSIVASEVLRVKTWRVQGHFRDEFSRGREQQC